MFWAEALKITGFSPGAKAPGYSAMRLSQGAAFLFNPEYQQV